VSLFALVKKCTVTLLTLASGFCQHALQRHSLVNAVIVQPECTILGLKNTPSRQTISLYAKFAPHLAFPAHQLPNSCRDIDSNVITSDGLYSDCTTIHYPGDAFFTLSVYRNGCRQCHETRRRVGCCRYGIHLPSSSTLSRAGWTASPISRSRIKFDHGGGEGPECCARANAQCARAIATLFTTSLRIASFDGVECQKNAFG
jgi:hypothetical protein